VKAAFLYGCLSVKKREVLARKPQFGDVLVVRVVRIARAKQFGGRVLGFPPNCCPRFLTQKFDKFDKLLDPIPRYRV